MPSELKMMCDEHGRPRSPLDDILGLETLSPEEEQRILERHEKVILPEMLRIMRQQAELAAQMRHKVFF